MILLWIVIPILTALNQIFIKLTAQSIGNLEFGIEWLKIALLKPTMIGVIICEIASFVIWMKILAKSDLSKAFPISGINYILILLSGWFIFNEIILPLQIIGSVLIIIGVCLISTASTHK